MRSYKAARREEEGVSGAVEASFPDCELGVIGSAVREEDGVDGTTGIGDDAASRWLEVGVIGNGIANSPGLVGLRLVGDIEGFFDTRFRRVVTEPLDLGSGGRSANGISGTAAGCN